MNIIYLWYKFSNKLVLFFIKVLALAIIFFIMATGNIITVCHVIRQKLCGLPPVVLRSNLLKKYSFVEPQYTNSNITNFGDGEDYLIDNKLFKPKGCWAWLYERYLLDNPICIYFFIFEMLISNLFVIIVAIIIFWIYVSLFFFV